MKPKKPRESRLLGELCLKHLQKVIAHQWNCYSLLKWTIMPIKWTLSPAIILIYALRQYTLPHILDVKCDYSY